MFYYLLPLFHLLWICSYSLTHLLQYRFVHPTRYSTPLLVAGAFVLYLARPTLFRTVVTYVSPQLYRVESITQLFACRTYVAISRRVVAELFFRVQPSLFICRCLLLCYIKSYPFLLTLLHF